MKKNVGIFVLVLASLLGLSLSIFLSPKTIEKDQRAQYLEGGDFALQSYDQVVSLGQMSGTPSILYFGFTFCPDICPIGLTVVRDALASNVDFEKVNVMFVTVDPERDTPERLKEYLEFFNPDFIGLTGSIEEIKEVANRYGTYFAKSEETAPGEYSVDHTAYYYVIDQKGELVRVLGHDTDASTLASVLKELI